MENKKKYIPWIILIIVLVIISICIIWYFYRPQKLDVIEDFPPTVEGALTKEEIICRI